MHRHATVFTILILSALLCSCAYDNNRIGPIASLGIGAHKFEISGTSTEGDNLSISESGLATSLRLGVGLSDNLLIYYVRNASWFSDAGDSFVSGLSAIGASLYFKKKYPSPFIFAAVGKADLSVVDEPQFGTWEGDGKLIGLGYEYAKHQNIELVYMDYQLDIDPAVNSNNPVINSWQLLLTFQWY